MSKGYKPEYLEKVKAKFNDLQSSSKGNRNVIAKPQNDKRSEVCKSNAMVKLR